MSESVPAEFIINPGANPHAANEQLRAQCPVHKIDYPPGTESYVVVTHESVSRAFRDPRLSKRLDNAPRTSPTARPTRSPRCTPPAGRSHAPGP